jgi:hypothetical protein
MNKLISTLPDIPEISSPPKFLGRLNAYAAPFAGNLIARDA